jgi:hypothetical protein
LFAPPFVMVLLALLLYIGLLSLFLLDVAWRCCIAKGIGHRAALRHAQWPGRRDAYWGIKVSVFGESQELPWRLL